MTALLTSNGMTTQMDGQAPIDILYDQSPWDRGGIELAIPGSTVRQVYALGHVTDCVKQPQSDRY